MGMATTYTSEEADMTMVISHTEKKLSKRGPVCQQLPT